MSIPKKYVPRKRRVNYRRRRFVKSGGKLTVKSTLGPRRATVKMAFSKTAQFNAGSANVPSTNQLLRLNSIWDPDTDVSPSQPTANGWASWQLMFERYRVYAVEYDVEIMNIQGISAVTAAIMPSYGSLTFANVNEFTQYASKKCTLAPVQGQNRARLRGKYYLPIIKGQSAAQFKADPSNASLYSSNPADQCFLSVGTLAIDPQSTCVVQLNMKVIYHVELYEPLQKIVSQFNDETGQETGPSGP